jgi:DNA-directed RNA polymerase beta subunit
MRLPNLPASFNVLLKTLRGLSLNVELISKPKAAVSDEE